MKVVILEDEAIAADHLVSILNGLEDDLEITAVLDSVKSGVIWFLKNEHPDVVFMDIQLGDGLSFEILDAVQINCPIIFTTAFDEYALKAFKVNSVDYILKPVEHEDVSGAFDKMKKLKDQLVSPTHENILKVSQMLSENYKERFIVKIGEHIHSIETRNIVFFFSENKATYCMTKEGKKYLIDFPLDRVEAVVPPNRFFRVNRSHIISFEAIDDIVQYSNSRLKLKLPFWPDEGVIVSRERVSAFREWLDK